MKKYAALAVLFGLATTGSAHAELDMAVWTLEKGKGNVSLIYSVPQSDDFRLSFSCTPQSGKINIWISETDANLKAGRKATAILSIGETTARVAGKLETNEEAGAPSFSGAMRADDPVIAAMATAKDITIAVGRSKDSTPLKGAADKVRELIKTCAKL